MASAGVASNNTGGAADAELQRKIEEYKARERIYLAGLVATEAEMNHLRQMASDVLGAYGDTSHAAVRASLVDPAQNMEVLLLRQKAREKDQHIAQLREELEANSFDQKTAAGQALMRKCKALLEENRELGEEIREGRLAELRAAVQSEQMQNAQLRQKCDEAAEFCQELSQENDKLQGTIAKVFGRLREARAELEIVRKERAEAKAFRKKERAQQKAAQEAAAAAAAAAVAVGVPGVGLAGQDSSLLASPVQLLSQSPAQTAALSPEMLNDKPKKSKDKGDKEKKTKKRKHEEALGT